MSALAHVCITDTYFIALLTRSAFLTLKKTSCHPIHPCLGVFYSEDKVSPPGQFNRVFFFQVIVLPNVFLFQKKEKTLGIQKNEVSNQVSPLVCFREGQNCRIKKLDLLFCFSLLFIVFGKLGPIFKVPCTVAITFLFLVVYYFVLLSKS